MPDLHLRNVIYLKTSHRKNLEKLREQRVTCRAISALVGVGDALRSGRCETGMFGLP